MEYVRRLLSVSRGDSPADLVLTNARVVNTFSGEIEPTDVAIVDGTIAGLGSGLSGRRTMDLGGAFLAPGLIDAHVHIESSHCVPEQFATAVVPRGVCTVVADPHEIANVAGAAGVRWMAAASAGLPLDVILMAPSCVPATSMATAGGRLGAADVQQLRADGLVHGLAEVMNYPGVIAGDGELLAKISAYAGRPVDGHSPSVVGPRLNAYVTAGIGSDHESVTAVEAREKLARGIYVLIREATGARNLDALLPMITPANSRRICFCTDDRTPMELLAAGSVDEMLRRTIAAGVDPIEAIRMATLNPAEWFGLRHLGAIAPGRTANMFVFDDLRRPMARIVFSNGQVVARDGKLTEGAIAPAGSMPSAEGLGRCQVDWEAVRWDVPVRSSRIRVIGSMPDQLVTEHRILDATIVRGSAVADVSRDVLKMAVIQRHRLPTNAGVGFIQGVGLRHGAIAGTVAHDHHNLVVIGADDASMQAAARVVVEMGGGLAVAAGGKVLAQVSFPIGGLISDRPIEEVAAAYAAVVSAAKGLGSPLSDPFMSMSFMALEVIPALKLTDLGLVDVEQFRIVDLFV